VNIPDGPVLPKKVEQFLRSDVVAADRQSPITVIFSRWSFSGGVDD